MKITVNDIEYKFSATHWPAKMSGREMKRPEMVDLRCDYGKCWCETPIVIDAPKDSTWCKDSIEDQVKQMKLRFDPMPDGFVKAFNTALHDIVHVVKTCLPSKRK